LVDNQKCAVLAHPRGGAVHFHPRFVDLAGHYGFVPRACLIVTSNKSFADWGEVFNDQVLATAILDRLLHHATTVNIKGDSYRLREKKKAGLLGRRPKPVDAEEAAAPA
jgi:hypothetical protein